jgi:hypothetical protein
MSQIPSSVINLIERMRDRLYCFAMEDADVDFEEQADAGALANEANSLLEMLMAKHGCHCDLENTASGEPDECVFDNGDIDDCVYARRLAAQGEGKAQCQYWRPVHIVSAKTGPTAA